MKKMMMNDLENVFTDMIQTLESGNVYVGRLINWSIVLLKKNEGGSSYTLTLYDPLDCEYFQLKTDIFEVGSLFEKIFVFLLDEYCEVKNDCKIKDAEDCERIWSGLPTPDKRPDNEGARRFFMEFALENDLSLKQA